MSFAIHQANLLGQARAEIATKDAEIARLRELASWIEWASANQTINHQNFRIHAGSRARAALSPIPDPAGGMPVEVET